MQKIQQKQNMSYEREIKELKEKYSIDICLRENNIMAIKI